MQVHRIVYIEIRKNSEYFIKTTLDVIIIHIKFYLNLKFFPIKLNLYLIALIVFQCCAHY